MHWFDRMSQQVAESPGRSTRRSVLKGATLGTLALPFLPAGIARATASPAQDAFSERIPDYVPLGSNNEFCSKCLARIYKDANAELNACGAYRPSRVLARPKGPTGKGAKKITPSRAAKFAACQARVMKLLSMNSQGCRLHFCESDSEPPATNPVTGQETCPPGTSPCSETLCCYGDDACCACGDRGPTCCAGVIGCTCC
jgi:hypothetical protein